MTLIDEVRGEENFTHLHVHTSYSLLDGYNDPKKCAKRAKELGMTHIAITDHNHVGGVIEFQKACKDEGINPILGCCLPDQMIYTSEGPKEIKDIQVGDMVLTHTGTYKQVKRHWNKFFKGTLYGINSWNSNTVWLTDEHPVYVKYFDHETKEFSMRWIRADEIDCSRKNKRYGEERKRIWQNYSVLPKVKSTESRDIHIVDYLDKEFYGEENGVIVKIKKRSKEDSLDNIKPLPSVIPTTKELMRLIGYFIAEGSYDFAVNDRACGIRFTFNIKEKRYVKEVKSAIKNIFGLECSVYENSFKNIAEINCNSTVLSQFFLSYIGRYCGTKQIPTEMLSYDSELQKELLIGIENGDGKITDKEVCIKLANKKLIYQIKILLTNLGYASSITEIKENLKLSWSIRYARNKNARVYYHEDENYIYMPIKEVLNKEYTGYVYNFEVEDDNSYVTDIVLHNCEVYWTFDTDILGMEKEDRDQWAIDRALAAGVTLPEAKGKKKPTKAEINVVLDPYKYDTHQYHIILLAINQTGWQNLVRLQSEAARKCTFNGRYLCDDEMLEKYNEGLIMTTACIGGIVPSLINDGKYQEASDQLDNWKRIFGDRFYIEIQPLNIEEQRLANLQMVSMANEKRIKIVATTDVHYTLKSDHDDHDTLLCIGTGKLKSEEDRMRYSNDFWIKSYDEMIETFDAQSDSMQEEYGSDIFDKNEYMQIIRDALANTNVIASMTEDIKLGSDIDLFPDIKIPFGMTAEKWLTLKCFQGLYKYKKKHPEIKLRLYEKRLNDELHVINTKGFAPYILVVQDYIEWANSHGCPTGPGRGSGAGSLVLFMLGITKVIDPIKYNLLFFRFLTMDRTAPPDIDTDFEYYNRDRVITYLEEKYGKECVAHIGTYSEEGVKSGLKDVGRVLGIDFGVMNTITKKVDEWLDMPSLKFKHLDALKDSSREFDRKAWEEFHQYELDYPELFRLARAFEGTKRNTGVHASGVLVTPMSVNELFPTRKAKDGTTVTLYTGVQLEELKAIKFDILGLKTLSVIKNTLTAIDESLTMDDLYEMVDVDDPQIFEVIQNKETEGLFQIESNLFKGMIEEIIPTGMNDIVVINALGRPGPLKAGMPKSYALRKNGKEEAVEPLRDTWEFVSDTYGTIAYQEQIMLIAKRVAGYDDNQADSHLRKAFAKKKKDKMALCRQWFIYGKRNEAAPEGYNAEDCNQPMYDAKGKYGPAIQGGIANGYEEQILVDFWTNIEGFADYLFNKSHAACYAYICMLTGWLKTYYPAKFLAALLSTQKEQEKIDTYIKVARNMSIHVMAPNINLSERDFAEVDGNILYGLGSIKGVGEASIDPIIDNRPYTSVEDAIEKIEKKAFKKNVGEAIISAGGFDWLNPNRFELVNIFHTVRKDKKEEILDIDQYDEQMCIEMEKHFLGSPVTYVPWWDQVQAGEVVEVNLNMESVQEKQDKNSNMMAFVNGNFEGSPIRAIVFARQYCNNADKFDMQYHQVVRLKGKKDDKGCLVVNKVMEVERPRDAHRQVSWIAGGHEVEERLGDVI
jgi:DNA polymerase-3 subunit alpha